MSGPMIRRMAAAEAEAVAELLIVANEDNLTSFPGDVADSYREELRTFSARFAAAEVYVADDAGRVIGAVTFLPDSADDEHPWPRGGSVIRFLVVRSQSRGQGTGEALTVECIGRARQLKSRFVALHTAPSMAPARRMYERLGFRRSPAHDFHPDDHYGGGAHDDVRPWGLAYLLPLE